MGVEFVPLQLRIKAAAKAKSGFKAWKAVVFLICFVVFFAFFAVPMGIANMMNTMMNTAYRLLMGNPTLYLMAIAVIDGALFRRAYGIRRS